VPPTSVPIYVVDAFAEDAFRGNPAGVCVLGAPREDAWMRSVAAEMRHSETAFVVPGTGEIGLRWFTPEVEVDLCGHATLASAHVLWETGRVPRGERIAFRTRSGRLEATPRDGGVEIVLPGSAVEPTTLPDGLLRAVGVAKPVRTARNRETYVVEARTEDEVRALRPDPSEILAWTRRGAHGEDVGRRVLVTAAASTPGFDVVSRYFAPAVGIAEDPVTGVAHCVLGPYWSNHLGRDRFVAYQASARGGVVRVEVRGDRVALAGSAITVLRGELLG
jgi:PhzF family phenazine biosynthesis protein